MQSATLLLLALALEASDYGRYVTAVALANMLAPLLMSGPAVVYQQSHRAFGSTRGQIATLWTRTLLVVGLPCAALVTLGMVLVANGAGTWWMWFAVGLSEIVMLGFAEMRACFEQTQGRDGCKVFWQAAPHASRLLVVIPVIASGATLSLQAWVLVALASATFIACFAFGVQRKDAPRSWDAVRRLVRVGFRYGAGGAANRVMLDGDKPIVLRAIDPATSGALFLAQRVVELLCFPLQTAVASALPGLLHAEPEARAALWRRALWWPMVYAVLAGAALFGLSALLDAHSPAYDTTADALAWLCWLPMVDFARGMLGNAAILNGRGDAFTHGLWLGAILRVVAVLMFVGSMGWRGAVVGLVVAEVATLAYLLVSARRAAVVARQVRNAES